MKPIRHCILFEKKGRKYGPDYINVSEKIGFLTWPPIICTGLLIALSKAALHMQQKLLLDNGDLSPGNPEKNRGNAPTAKAAYHASPAAA
ncbi:hypothetical protein [Duffyella gerundensis]|uniref:hypothetical protein n=1 Tax=Duffyella gerundensis TaxID=1619313 RepID=UPI0021F756A3|nr:hypothetical protein [Duffyella gerundensis]